MGSRVVPPPDLKVYLRPRVTLTFDPLSPMRLSRRPFVPICIKIGYSFLKYFAHKFGNNLDKNVMLHASLAWRRRNQYKNTGQLGIMYCKKHRLG